MSEQDDFAYAEEPEFTPGLGSVGQMQQPSNLDLGGGVQKAIDDHANDKQAEPTEPADEPQTPAEDTPAEPEKAADDAGEQADTKAADGEAADDAADDSTELSNETEIMYENPDGTRVPVTVGEMMEAWAADKSADKELTGNVGGMTEIPQEVANYDPDAVAGVAEYRAAKEKIEAQRPALQAKYGEVKNKFDEITARLNTAANDPDAQMDNDEFSRLQWAHSEKKKELDTLAGQWGTLENQDKELDERNGRLVTDHLARVLGTLGKDFANPDTAPGAVRGIATQLSERYKIDAGELQSVMISNPKFAAMALDLSNMLKLQRGAKQSVKQMLAQGGQKANGKSRAFVVKGKSTVAASQKTATPAAKGKGGNRKYTQTKAMKESSARGEGLEGQLRHLAPQVFGTS